MRKVINQKRLRQWEAAGGVGCFLAGIIAALLGSLLTASSWILGAEIHPWVHAAGTVLLIAAIPLILFAGYCLDWAERRPNKASDNDRNPAQGKASQTPIMISKEVKRAVEEAEVTQDKKTSLVSVENGNGVGSLYKIGLDKSLKTRGEHSAGDDSEGIEGVLSLVGKRSKERV